MMVLDDESARKVEEKSLIGLGWESKNIKLGSLKLEGTFLDCFKFKISFQNNLSLDINYSILSKKTLTFLVNTERQAKDL